MRHSYILVYTIYTMGGEITNGGLIINSNVVVTSSYILVHTYYIMEETRNLKAKGANASIVIDEKFLSKMTIRELKEIRRKIDKLLEGI